MISQSKKQVKIKMNISSSIKVSFFLIFLFGYSLYAQQSTEKWVEDIDYYYKNIELRHIDLYSNISKTDFTTELDDLKKRVPSLTDFEIKIELMKLTHKIGAGKGDGHTAVPLWGEAIHKFPIKIYDIENELRVIATNEMQRDLLGRKLIKINEIPVRDISRKISEITPYTENKQSSMDRTSRYMMISELLHSFRFIDDPSKASFTFLDKNNKEQTTVIHSVTSKAFDSLNFQRLEFSNPKVDIPTDRKFKKLWFSNFHNSQTVYINFGSYPSHQDMESFGEEVFNYMNKHKSTALIIDLRNNYGGDFFKGLNLMSWLNLADSIQWKDKVYVLVNRKTYSAAMVNAVQMKQILNAKVVGEPTGANPNGYQDMGMFSLPNSKLQVTYSKRLFRLEESNKSGLQPDILIPPKWEHYKNGLDEVLQWVLNDIKN